MNDEQLRRRVVAATQFPADQVASWDLAPAEAELLDRILHSEVANDAAGPRMSRPFFGFRWRRPALAATAVALAAVAVVVISSTLGGGGGSGFAEAAVQVAEANPRLLVTEPGWRVVRADQFEADQGEIAFSDGSHDLTMTWYPASEYQSYYRDRNEVPSTQMEFANLGSSRTVRYGANDYATMLTPQGDIFIEIRADLDAATYQQVVGSIEPTTVDNWLAAMPDSVVQPPDRASTVDAMAADMPIPPGLSLDSLRQEDGVLDRYQLGAKVSSTVACGWLDLWANGIRTGDDTAVAQATAAMGTSHNWAILQEIKSQGGYSQAVWEIADQMKGGNSSDLLTPAGSDTTADGRKTVFGPKYATALGCASEYHRPEGGRG